MRPLQVSSLPIRLFYMVPFSYYQIDPIKESLIDAGFTDISVAVIRLEKEIPDAARFARGLVHGNPLIDQIKARGGVDPDRIVNAWRRLCVKNSAAIQVGCLSKQSYFRPTGASAPHVSEARRCGCNDRHRYR